MSVNPRVRDVVRQMWPKRQPRRPRASRTPVVDVLAAIRRAEMTVVEAARAAAVDPDYLARKVWAEVKADVVRRDDGCTQCGARSQLDAHHRRARKAGGTADPAIAYGMANLVTLCRTHHDWAEANPNLARACGLRLDSGQTPTVERIHVVGGWVLLSNDGSIRPADGAVS